MPADDLSGVRHGGGGSLVLARTWNVGTCRSDGKGSSQASGPGERVRTEAEHRGGGTRSSVDAAERRSSEGVPSLGVARRSTGNRRSR